MPEWDTWDRGDKESDYRVLGNTKADSVNTCQAVGLLGYVKTKI
jgi:hypothetical protein